MLFVIFTIRQFKRARHDIFTDWYINMLEDTGAKLKRDITKVSNSIKVQSFEDCPEDKIFQKLIQKQNSFQRALKRLFSITLLIALLS